MDLADENINIVSVNKKFSSPIYRIWSIFRNNEKISKIRPQNSLRSPMRRAVDISN